MAITLATLGIQPGIKTARDSDCDSTAEINIFGGPATVYVILISNPNGAAEYLKMYDTASSVTVGTTVPDHIFMVAASQQPVLYFCLEGWDFVNGVTIACVTAGGTAGTTNPTSDVIVDLIAFA